MKKVVVLVGPTASGKTSYSIKLAKSFGFEIINGDSVQIYKELNIGSAKVTKSEKAGISHHLLDVLNPGESFSAYDFQKLARKKISQIKLPMVVGGTGFYIKSALYNYEFNKEDKNINDGLDDLTKEELYERLIKLDSKIIIDKNNKRRLIRALRLAIDDNPRSEKQGKNTPLYEVLTIYLDIDRTVLNKRLNKRLNNMIDNGFIEEVEKLRAKNIHLNIIGYREIDNYLNGEYSLDEAKDKIIIASRRFAKRQRTWFINQMEANCFDPLNSESLNKIEDLIKTFLGV